MAVIRPTDIFTGLTVANDAITIPLSSLPGLTLTEANAANGDGRELLRIICETIVTKLDAMDAAARPTRMTYAKGVPSGVSANVFRQSYNFNFDVATIATAMSLVAEP